MISGTHDYVAAAIVFVLLFCNFIALGGIARQIELLRQAMIETFTDDERFDHA